MPEQLSVVEFLEYTKDDVENPSKTVFTSKLGLCRGTIAILEEMLETDRSGLSKMKKSIKALSNSGKAHAANEVLLYENLEKLGANALSRDNETELGAAFLKFAVVTKELSNLLKNLVQGLENIVLFPLDSLLKGEIKGTKGDIRKALDRAIKDLDAKLVKIEKEKKQLQKMETGHPKAGPSPEILIQHQAELERSEEEAEKDRRLVQLQMCEFLIKVNEIKTKKGCELLQHLVEFYHAQSNFFQDGLKTVEQFQTNIGELTSELHSIHQRQDAEKRQLSELKTLLKQTIATYKEPQSGAGVHSKAITPTNTLNNAYSACQPVTNKSYGSEKTGFLLKKSEGKMRKVWQRRKCMTRGGFLHIYHSDESSEPTKLNLLTCQVKLPRLPIPPTAEDGSGGTIGPAGSGAASSLSRRFFDLVSSAKNRTYHFQVEDDDSFEAWISVLNNSKEEALQTAFGAAPTGVSGELEESSSVRELRNGILEKIRQLPGNKFCCDCGAQDPEWLSTNLGILVCLECCGIHRDLGVHISRTQSTAIDNLGTAQLLVARAVGNALFNEIFEATLPPSHKLTQGSGMEARATFIRAKYCDRRYAIQTTASGEGGDEVVALGEDLLHDLKSAVVAKDVSGLLQCLAEGLDLFSTLLNTNNDENALHLAIGLESTTDGSPLYLIDFLIQNKDQPSDARLNFAPRTHGLNVLDRPDAKGNTPLHLCAALNRTEGMKLLLRNGASITEKNVEGQTALDIAKEKDHQLCCDLLEQGTEKKSALFENVNIDWDLDPWKDMDNDAHSYSDDDLDHSESSSAAAAHNRQSPGSEKRRRLLSTLSNASSTSRANQARPISCATPSKTDLVTRREHAQSTAESTSSSHSPVLSERKRSHTSDSIINAVIGACEDIDEPATHEGSRTLHSTPAKGGKENDSFSKSSTLNRPKSGHGTLKKRQAPQPPVAVTQSSATVSYATPLRKNPLNAVATQRKSGSVSEGEETILRSANGGKAGRTNSAIYSHSLPRSHLPPRLSGGDGADPSEGDAAFTDSAPINADGAPSRKEGKGGKPPLIVFLPDGKGYVLPPFRDIQQENVTERVMAPVVWDADAENEGAGVDELRDASDVASAAPAAPGASLNDTKHDESTAPIAAPRQMAAPLPPPPPLHKATEAVDIHRRLSSDDSQTSWKLKPKTGLPQLDSGQSMPRMAIESLDSRFYLAFLTPYLTPIPSRPSRSVCPSIGTVSVP